MSDLILNSIDKSNWQTFRFDQIAQSIGERVDPMKTDLEIYVGLEHIDAESIHIKRFGKREDVGGTKLRCYPGDVIFGRRRAYQRKAAICEFDGFCSAHSLVLRAIPEVIDPKLFPFFLHSDAFMHRAVDISVGSLSPTINWKTLKHQEFLLPPKDQQAKLAELLWAADAVVKRKQELPRLVRDSLAAEFDRRVRMTSKYNTELGSVLSDIVAGKSPKADSRPATESEYGVLKVSAVGNEEYVESENKALVDSSQFNEKYEVESGFVLVTRANAQPSGVGRPCYVKNTRTGLMLCDKTLRLVPKDDVISERILYQNLLSPFYRKHVESAIGGTEAKNISQASLRKAPVWCPPLKVQLEVDVLLASYDSAMDNALCSLDTSKQLLKSLINESF